MVTPNFNWAEVSASQNQKEVTINDTFNKIEDALSNSLTCAITASNVFTLTNAQFRENFFFNCTDGGITAAATLNVPSGILRGAFAVINNSGFTVTVQISGQSVTPPTVDDGEMIVVTSGGSAVRAPVAGVATFLGLTDTPASFSGQAGKAVLVNGGETALEFGEVAAAGGSTSTVNLTRRFRGALVTKTGDQALSAGFPGDVLTWDAEEYDTDSIHDNATNNSRLTVPAGVTRVRLTANLRWAVDTDDKYAQIFLNGSTAVVGLPGILQTGQVTNTDRQNMVSAVVDVSPGDYFEVKAWAAGAGSILGGTGDEVTWFAMEIVETSDAIIPEAVVVTKRELVRGARVSVASALGPGDLDGDISWDQELYDTDAIWASSPNPNRLTVPAGVTKVRVTANLWFGAVTGTGDSTCFVRIFENATDSVAVSNFDPPSAGDPACSLDSGILDVTEGDYFTVGLSFTDTSYTLNASSNFSMEIVETIDSGTVPTGYIAVSPLHRGALLELSAAESITSGSATATVPWDTAVYDTLFQPDDAGLPQRFWLGADQTFVDANVTVGTDNVAITGHGFSTGEGPLQLTTSGTLPTGLSTGTDYWIIKVDNNTIQFATSRANAIAGTQVDITAAAGGGTHTLDTGKWLVVPANVTKISLAGGAQFASNATGKREIFIEDDAGAALNGMSGSRNTAVSGSPTIIDVNSTVIEVTEGERISLRVFQDSGGPLDLTNVERTFFAIKVEQTDKPLSFPGVTVERPHIGCLLFNSGAQSLTNGVNTPLTFDSEEYDTGYRGTGFHSTSVNTDRITIPNGVTKVQLNATLRITDGTGTQCYLEIRKNGGLFNGMAAQDSETTGTDNCNVTTAVVEVTAGDYFTAEAFVSAASQTTVASTTNFSMTVIETDEAAFVPEPISVHLDTAAWNGGAFPTSNPVFKFICPRRFVLADEFLGSVGHADAGPNGGAVAIDVQRNGSSIGTINFADSTGAAQTATFTTTAATEEAFEIGDRLELVAPANWQSMDEIAIHLKAWRA